VNDLVERLADLTAHCDRDVLDASRVSARCELLSPTSVAMHRSASATKATSAG